MVAVKGLDILLKAAVLSKERGEPFYTYLIGEGPLCQGLQNDVVRLGLSELFHFVGTVPHHQLADWYRAADLTVLPSRSEGVPNVLRESLACGTPFVASNVGGIAEIAQEPMGRLIPPDDPAALSDTIELALKRPVGGASEGNTTQSWAASAKALLSVIGPLVANSTGLVKSPPGRLNWRQFLRGALGWLFPRQYFLVSGPASQRSVCLTFDDGPHPEHTPRLLDVLREHKVSATFFVIGEQAAKHPELIRRIAAEGHVVGNHTFSHGEPREVSTACLLNEVRQTRALLNGLVGETSNLFRPPKGELTPTKLGGLWREHQTVVLWNRDPKDYACQSSHELRAWFRRHPLSSGDVVLMHDREPHAAVALPDVIEDAKRRGLRFATIREWTT
jgi:peptidoglycan/xylan/chitin deacetylase (PgdA/CDA1 family)